ncbi:MAG: ADP-ribosylglycohydrolase family protein [Acidobacteriia bacterium]|nr:ADP-ribosylglycohydrolase family protein [Terriglobia bacterium]
MLRRGVWTSALLILTLAMSASGRTLTLSQEALLDRICGGWAGKMVGVTYGAPTEFRYRQRLNEDPRNWKPEELAGALDQDDLYVQMTFAGVMDRWGLEATTERFGEAHRDSKYRLWHANLRARRLLLRGVSATLSGHPDYNFHTNEIGTQFEADFIGLMCPGMPRAAQKYSDRFGHVIAYGDGVYAGMFVSGMYTAAFFERDPRRVVEAGLASIPSGSRYAQMVRDVLTWSAHNPDWKTTWKLINEKWDRDDACPEGALKPFNISAVLNGAYVTMGLLYGGGDFDKTLEITMRAGQDSDCNPGTAGGVLGTMLGFKALPAKWVKHLPVIADKTFSFTNYSFNSIVASTIARAKRTVENEGGRIEADRIVIPLQKARKVKLEQFWAGHVAERVSSEDSRWTWRGDWEKTPREDGYRRFSLRSRAAGAQATINFMGTGALLVGALQRDGGMADVYLDGELSATLDAYNSDNRNNEGLWGKFDLRRGVHTLRVVAKGTPFPGSAGSWVCLEDLIVYRK